MTDRLETAREHARWRNYLKRRLPAISDDEDLKAFLGAFRLTDYTDALAKLLTHGLPVATEPVITAAATAAETAESADPPALGRLVDESFALPGAPVDLGLLPVPDHFVGRAADLDWILARLRAGELSDIVALGGLGGIGKSALAGAAARILAAEGRFPDGIAVVLCAGLTDPVEVLRRALTRFDPQRRAPDADDLPGLAEAALALLAGKQALVVLDNVEPNWPVELAIAPLRAAGATMLVTARQRLPGAAVPVEGARQLDLLSPAEALTLFAQSYGRAGSHELTPGERVAAERIVRELDRHTLAVKLAGAYAATTGRDPAALAAELANPLRALALPEDEAPEKVQRIFAASAEALPAEERRLFAALAIFPANEFGRQAVLAVADALRLTDSEASLNLLGRRALLEATINETMPAASDRERLRLHPLLRAFAAGELNADTRAIASLALARFYARYTLATPDAALTPDEDNIAGSIEWAHAHNEGDEVADLCDGMRHFWRDRGKTAAGLRYLPWGIAAAEAAARDGDWGKRLRAVRLALNYGHILQNTGKLAEAERVFQTNLAIRREVEDRQGEGLVLSNLGDVARLRGRLDEAVGYYEQSLAIRREVGDRRGEGVVLSNLGQVAQARGRLDEAADYYELALAIAREIGDRQGEGVVLTALGQVAQDRGRLREAAQYFGEALAIAREIGDRQGEGAILTALGQVVQIQGRLDEAVGYYEQSLAIRREVGDRRGEGVVLTALGQVAQFRGRLDEAADYYEQALLIRREVEDRRGEGAVIGQMGQVARLRGRLDEAQRYYEQALAIAHEVGDRRGEGIDLTSLGQVAQDHGRLDEAQRYYEQALAIVREVGNRPEEGVVLFSLAQIAESRGDLEHAELLHRNSLAIGIEVQSGPDIADSYRTLGRFLIQHGRGQPDEGCGMLREALRLYHEMGLSDREAEARAAVREWGCANGAAGDDATG